MSGAGRDDVVPPAGGSQREVDQRFGGIDTLGMTVTQLDADRCGAVVAERVDSEVLSEHCVKGDGVPGAVGKIAPLADRHPERRRDRRERERHQDSLGARDEGDVSRRLQVTKHLARLGTGER